MAQVRVGRVVGVVQWWCGARVRHIAKHEAQDIQPYPRQNQNQGVVIGKKICYARTAMAAVVKPSGRGTEPCHSVIMRHDRCS